MTAATLTRKTARQNGPPQAPAVPPKPDQQLWKADKAKAFEAGVRWFLAVSRNA